MLHANSQTWIMRRGHLVRFLGTKRRSLGTQVLKAAGRASIQGMQHGHATQLSFPGFASFCLKPRVDWDGTWASAECTLCYKGFSMRTSTCQAEMQEYRYNQGKRSLQLARRHEAREVLKVRTAGNKMHIVIVPKHHAYRASYDCVVKMFSLFSRCSYFFSLRSLVRPPQHAFRVVEGGRHMSTG